MGIFFSLTFIASTAPIIGGNQLAGGLIALIGMFFVALAFSAVSILTPRTAGDYVFSSRYLHPALGFVGNAGYFVATVPMFMGITITTIESFGFSSLFAYWGYATGNLGFLSLATTLSHPAYELALGGGLTIVFALLPFFGYRAFKTMNKVILPLILIAVAAMFIILGTTSPADAHSRLNSLVGIDLYSTTSSFAANNSIVVPAATSLSTSLAQSAVYIVGFSYIISAVYVAGEVRQVKKNMPIAIMATLLIAFIIFAGSTALSYNAFGYNFLSNLYTQSISFASSPIPVIAYLNFLSAAISNNIYLGSFIIIVAIIQLLWYQTNAVFVGGRLLLSYSFDRIMPAFMGDVSEKYHVPAKAMIVSLVIGLLAGVLFVLPFTSGVAFLMSSAASAIIILFPMTIVGIALLVYRFRRSKEFHSSALAGSYLGGPLFVVCAIVTIVFTLGMFYEYVTVPALFGFAATEGLELIFVPILILFAIYYASKFINASRGVHFEQIFNEIPPE